MILPLVLKALSPDAVRFAVKYLIRPSLYLACVLAVWSWDSNRIATIRADAAREKALAIESRDNHWKAEIERGNAEVRARESARAALAAAEAERAATERAELARQLTELERANAALPTSDACGLDRARVRLLRGQTAGSGPDDPRR